MSHYKHPRQLQTLARSCTDKSTGASSCVQSIYGSMRAGTPKGVYIELRHTQNIYMSSAKWHSTVKNVLQAASNSFERTPQSAARILLSTSALALAKQSDEETSDGLDGQDASRPLSVDVKRFLEANKLPHKEGHHAALPLTCPLCERESSQTVFINKMTGGLVCPPCKVHGELVRPGGSSGFMYLCVLWMYVSAM